MKKNIQLIAIVVIALVVALTGYALRPKDEAIDIPISNETQDTNISTASDDSFSAEELDETWDDASATHITFNEVNALVEGDGAQFSKGTVTITQAGTYVLTGAGQDVQVVVNANKNNDVVRLVLNGVTLNHSTSAPVNIMVAKKTIITLASGTNNSLFDAETYVYAAGEDEPNAALFSKDDLVINGSGTLNITAKYKNGINAKDDLKIANGNFVIQAENDAIKGKDSVVIRDGAFDLTSVGDGIQSSNDTDASKGWLKISNGTFKIKANGDAIQAETNLTISNGDFTIQTLANTTDSSNKGLKAGSLITIESGTYAINSVDDAVHANGDVTINGGNFVIQTGDDGMHADATLTINNGVIDIQESYEGLEGADVIINGGDISVIASDDGVNAAGGADAAEETNGRPQDRFSSAGNNSIVINGGTLVVDASGDGIDSNGNLTFNGGDVTVYGPVNDGDGGLDFDGQSTITGGTLVVSGSSGMMQTPGEDSTQNVLTTVFSSKQNAGAEYTIKDETRSVIFTFKPKKQFQLVTFSSENLVKGKTYTIALNGTDLYEVNLTDTITNRSDSGTAVQGGMGGMGGGPQGGMGGPQGGNQEGMPGRPNN